MSLTIFGQVKAENNNLIVPKEIFKEIRTALNDYESLKQTVHQKDIEIQHLELKVTKLQSINVATQTKITLLTERVEEMKLTFLEKMMKDYGFLVGLVLGVFVAK